MMTVSVVRAPRVGAGLRAQLVGLVLHLSLFGATPRSDEQGRAIPAAKSAATTASTDPVREELEAAGRARTATVRRLTTMAAAAPIQTGSGRCTGWR